MSPLLIAVTNESTVESDADVQARLQALDDQVNLDLAPIWQVPQVQSVFVPKGQPIPAEAQRLERVLDDADQAGALGYHSDSAQEGIPTSYIFSRTALSANASPSNVHSHERCEAAVDPFISYTVSLDLQIGGFRGGLSAVVMAEVSDGPEADQFGYKRNGILLANFVTPLWFSMPWKAPVGFKTGQFDFAGNVSAAFGLTNQGKPVGINPGGYLALRLERVVRDWYQVFAKHEESIQAIEQAIPPGHAHIVQHDGAIVDPATVCPFTRKGRWLARHKQVA